jgi:hypothetical protein
MTALRLFLCDSVTRWFQAPDRLFGPEATPLLGQARQPAA